MTDGRYLMGDESKRSALFYFACISSGIAWGLLVSLILAAYDIPPVLRVGAFFAPALGVLAGEAAAFFKRVGSIGNGALALLTLYATATLWGLGSGATFQLFDPSPRHLPLAVSAFLMPYGMTVTGHVLWMWPLAYLNNRLVAGFA